MAIEIEITNKEDALAALAAVVAFVEALPESEAPATDALAAEEFTLPSSAELADKETTTKEQVPELATKLGLVTEGKKTSELRALLVSLAQVAEEAEVEDDVLNNLAEALGLTPDKKAAKTLAAIKEWLAALGTSGEVATDAPAADPDDAPAVVDPDDAPAAADAVTDPDDAPAEGAAPAEESANSDGVERETVAKTFKKFPDLKTMVARLTAFNAAADTEIAFNAKKEPSVKDAYRQLVAEMVTSSEEIAEWGVPYFRDNGGWCCGLALADVKIKGQTNPCGRCLVTKKAFVLSDDQSEFTAIKG